MIRVNGIINQENVNTFYSGKNGATLRSDSTLAAA
jgi:hypothetical protein